MLCYVAQCYIVALLTSLTAVTPLYRLRVAVKLVNNLHSVFFQSAKFQFANFHSAIFSPSFSRPANSTPATSSVKFQSCIFQSCKFSYRLDGSQSVFERT